MILNSVKRHAVRVSNRVAVSSNPSLYDDVDMRCAGVGLGPKGRHLDITKGHEGQTLDRQVNFRFFL